MRILKVIFSILTIAIFSWLLFLLFSTNIKRIELSEITEIIILTELLVAFLSIRIGLALNRTDIPSLLLLVALVIVATITHYNNLHITLGIQLLSCLLIGIIIRTVSLLISNKTIALLNYLTGAIILFIVIFHPANNLPYLIAEVFLVGLTVSGLYSLVKNRT